MGRPSSGRPASAGVWVGLVNPPAINSTIAATRLEHAFSARGKVMVAVRLGQPAVPGLGPRLRRGGTWVRARFSTAWAIA
jgi:hypothetical protein